MELIADSLLLAATVGAAIYCYVLAARLRRFTTLETGMGGAIAVLSAQVDDMTKALQKAQGVASGSEQRLAELTARADVLAKRLELMVASLHDLPEPARPPAPGPSFTAAAAAPDPGVFARTRVCRCPRRRMRTATTALRAAARGARVAAWRTRNEAARWTRGVDPDRADVCLFRGPAAGRRAGCLACAGGGGGDGRGRSARSDRGATCPAPPVEMAAALLERENRLAAREAALADREAAMELADAAIRDRLAELEAAEEELRQTLALADGAAEEDLARLTAVYEAMKPKDAAALFDAMEPQFAAGFLGRMRADAAAAIMAGMTPEKAYAVSAILAGRNTGVPTE